MPEYHFIDHRIEIVSHDKDYLKVTVYEIAEAKYSPLKSKAEWRLERRAKTTTTKKAFTQDYYIALALQQLVSGFSRD